MMKDTLTGIHWKNIESNILSLEAAQEEYQHVYTSITDLYNKDLTLSYALEWIDLRTDYKILLYDYIILNITPVSTTTQTITPSYY